MNISFKKLKTDALALYVDDIRIENALVWPTDYTYYPDGNHNYPIKWTCILDVFDTSQKNLAKMQHAKSEIESKRLLVEAFVKQHFEKN